MNFAILSLPKSISFYFGHLDCFFFCVNSFWAFGSRSLILFTCSFSLVFLFQNLLIPQNSLSASLLVLKFISGYQARPFLNWNGNIKWENSWTDHTWLSHLKVHPQELPCDQDGPGNMPPKKHVAKTHQSVSELLALTMGPVDTVGENRDLVRTQGRWKGGAKSAGRNGEPAPRAREAPRWWGFQSTNLLSFRETSPPHELLASMTAAGCPGMGSDPSTTALHIPPPRQARVLENRDWFIRLCVPFCLAHCSSHCSLHRCLLSWTQVHLMLVPTYVCSETINLKNISSLLPCFSWFLCPHWLSFLIPLSSFHNFFSFLFPL